jgi:RNA-binding protein
MTLNNADKKRFRAIGQLIKLKLITGDKAEKAALIDEICALSKGAVVQTIGHVVLLYRAAKKQDPKLSNLVRFQS